MITAHTEIQRDQGKENLWGFQVKDIQEFFVLFLHVFFDSEIMSNKKYCESSAT